MINLPAQISYIELGIHKNWKKYMSSFLILYFLILTLQSSLLIPSRRPRPCIVCRRDTFFKYLFWVAVEIVKPKRRNKNSPDTIRVYPSTAKLRLRLREKNVYIYFPITTIYVGINDIIGISAWENNWKYFFFRFKSKSYTCRQN